MTDNSEWVVKQPYANLIIYLSRIVKTKDSPIREYNHNKGKAIRFFSLKSAELACQKFDQIEEIKRPIRKILGEELAKAGLNYLSAKDTQRDNGAWRIDEIVTRTEEEAEAVEYWADEKGYIVLLVRVASEEEAKRWLDK